MKLLITTLPPGEPARSIARELVQRGLAACAQLEPIESLYRWDGALEEDTEWRLLLKTSAAGLPALLDALRALHPYDCPALHTLSPDWTDPAFASWVSACVTPPAPATRRDPA